MQIIKSVSLQVEFWGTGIFFFPNPNASYSWLFSVPKARPEAEEVSAPPVVEDGNMFFGSALISMKIVQGGLYNVCMIWWYVGSIGHIVVVQYIILHKLFMFCIVPELGDISLTLCSVSQCMEHIHGISTNTTEARHAMSFVDCPSVHSHAAWTIY